MPRHHRYRLLILSTISLIIYLSFTYLNPLHAQHHHPSPHPTTNSTLNFGTLLAVSPPSSPRRSSLLWAANLTSLDITIPTQPVWSDAEIEKFRSKEGSIISKGSARAWMGHLNVLRWFVESGVGTALVVEDDVDFSIGIRGQVGGWEGAVRRIVGLEKSSRSKEGAQGEDEDEDMEYWGPQDAWDILYPGHCDDFFPSSLYSSHPAVLYADDSAPVHASLHPATQHFLEYMNVPPASRLVHRAFFPFCTFAYAVTRQSVMRILEHFGKEKEGGISAFDVQLLEACRNGWRCWSVVPELFHHGNGGSEIFRADRKQDGHEEQTQKLDQNQGYGKKRRSEDTVHGEVEQSKGFARATWNIECGARSRAFWVDEEDEKGREEMKRVVEGYIERGECPISRGGEMEWVGCEEGECGGQS